MDLTIGTLGAAEAALGKTEAIQLAAKPLPSVSDTAVAGAAEATSRAAEAEGAPIAAEATRGEPAAPASTLPCAAEAARGEPCAAEAARGEPAAPAVGAVEDLRTARAPLTKQLLFLNY